MSHRTDHHQVRVAVFDLDGTLVDAFADITEAVNFPLRLRGLPTHSEEAIRSMVGDGAGKLLERAVPPVSPEEFEAIRAEMMQYYHDHPADNASLYPGIYQLLESLSDWGVKLAVLSNKPHAMTVKTCEQVGLTKYFHDIAGEDGDRIPRKPDPRGLREQLGRLGATKAVYIGDGVPDGEVARNAGVPFIACLWGTRTREELEPTGPVAYADQPMQLTSLVLNILR